MDDIDAMFSDLLGEMDLLTQVGQGQLSDMKGIIAIYIYQSIIFNKALIVLFRIV